MIDECDIAIVGAGAAGLMAAICAGRTAAGGKRIVVLDGARHLGAKILVAGGGRCNVTHDVVDEFAFAGSSPAAIRKVLRRFDVQRTVEFFHELGVELKREETGKLFPTTDRARTVLDALLNAARNAGVEIRHPWRVKSVNVNTVKEVAVTSNADQPHFAITGETDVIHAHHVILATGGMSLPKSGSDGHGYAIARRLGHSITEHVHPALVPLLLADGDFLTKLSGLSTIATLEVRAGTGKRLHAFTDSMLCTHFGLSGPAVLDISRYYAAAKFADPATKLIINFLPGETLEHVDSALMQLGKRSPARWLGEFRCRASPTHQMPSRLAKALCEHAGIDPSSPGHQLTREMRRDLAMTLTQLEVPIVGDRGYAHAEVTAGGVPLLEMRLESMESRVCPGLFLCGEICDVDGRIGGYNFQWAWSSGYVAGKAAAEESGQIK